MNAGQDSSSPAKADSITSKLDKLLQQYEEGIGLPLAPENDEAARLLSLKGEDLRRMNSEECGEGAFLLRQRAYHVQREHNKEVGHANWCKDRIRELVADKVGSIKGFSYEERRAVACLPANNVAGWKMERLRIAAQLRADRLNFLATRISEMAKSLEDLSYSKRQKERNG